MSARRRLFILSLMASVMVLAISSFIYVKLHNAIEDEISVQISSTCNMVYRLVDKYYQMVMAGMFSKEQAIVEIKAILSNRDIKNGKPLNDDLDKIFKSAYPFILDLSNETLPMIVHPYYEGMSTRDISFDGVYWTRVLADKKDGFIRYNFQNPGEKSLKWEMGYIKYMPTWDWIIGVTADEEDFKPLYANILQWVYLITCVMLALLWYLLFFFSRKIIRPLEAAFFVATASQRNVLEKSQIKNAEQLSETSEIVNCFLQMKNEIDQERDMSQKSLDMRTSTEVQLAEKREELEKTLYYMEINRQKLITLTELSTTLSTQPSLEKAAELLAWSFKRLFASHGTSILMLDGDRLKVMAIGGYSIEAREYAEMIEFSPKDRSLSWKAIREKSAVISTDVWNDPDYNPVDNQVHSEVAIPLFYLEKPIGVVVLSFMEPSGIELLDMTMLSTFSTLIASLLYAQNMNITIKNSFRYLAERLLNVSGLQDQETTAHMERISAYSRILGLEMELDSSVVEDIVHYSRLHDIGKLKVPPSILFKRTKLSDLEWDELKRHTIYGGEIIGESPWLETARKIILHHHERWDGSGYPFGLARENIPLVARVVSVADVYDALREPRPYKPGFPHELALEKILGGDGRTDPRHFDPRLLEIFRKRHEDFRRIYDESAEA